MMKEQLEAIRKSALEEMCIRDRQTPGTGKAKHGFQRKRGRVIPWDGDETAPLRPAGQHIGKPAQAAAEVWTSQQFRSQRLPLLLLLS